MTDLGHFETKIAGWTLYEALGDTMRDEARHFNVDMPTEKQTALVVSALRMHGIMAHASSYDQRENYPYQDKRTGFYPIETSIGRWMRDAAREVLEDE